MNGSFAGLLLGGGGPYHQQHSLVNAFNIKTCLVYCLPCVPGEEALRLDGRRLAACWATAGVAATVPEDARAVSVRAHPLPTDQSGPAALLSAPVVEDC